MNFKRIDEARKILGLGEEASIEEVKEAFRCLSLQYHPDRCKDKDKKHCEAMYKKITHARDVIIGYFESYRYSFKEKDVKKNTMSKEEYEHLKRFYDGWFEDLNL